MKEKIRELYEDNKEVVDLYALYGGLGVILTALTTLAHFGVKKLLNVR